MFNKDYEQNKLNIVHALLSGVIVAFIFIAVLFVCRIAPFGDNTFLMYDLKRQYCDYYAYLKTVLKGENNIFYSFSTTLGSGTLGFFVYYLMSPFLVLLSFFDQESLYLGITLIIGLKLSLASFIMDLFMQRFIIPIRKNSLFDSSYISVFICSVSWAFSGYLFAHSMNMMWMDVVILLPLFVGCLESLIQSGKKKGYIITLFAILILNYYITYQVLLFSLLWLLMRMLVSKVSSPIKVILNYIAASFISVMMSAFLMLPTAIELMDSPKDVALYGLSLSGKNLNLIDFLSKIPCFSYDYIEARFGFPQIYCGVFMILLTVMFFLSKKISLRDKLGMGSLMLVLTVGMCKDILNIIWHALMEPSGHPYRQAFLYVFVIIICSGAALSHIDDEHNLLTILAGTCFFTAVLILVRKGRYDHFSDLSFKLNLCILAVFTILLLLKFVGNTREIRALSVVMIAVFIVSVVDLSINACFTYKNQAMKNEQASVYSQKVDATLEALSYVKDKDNSFYRMEDLNPRQQNDALQYAYNGVTHYSSAGRVNVRYFLQSLGYNDDELYTAYGHDNTEAADALLGVKYVLSDGTYNAHDDYPELFFGEKSVYENPYVLSVAIGVDDFDLTDIAGKEGNLPDMSMSHVPLLDPFRLQEDVLNRLCGKGLVGTLFTDAGVLESDVYISEEKYCKDYTATANADGELYFYLDGLIGKSESLSVFVEGEFLTTYGNESCCKVLNLGQKKKGDIVHLTVQGESEDDDLGSAVFVTEDPTVLKSAKELLSPNFCNIVKKSSSHIQIKTGNHKGVFMTI
nr:YfhO family protein [Butyrivibrio sp.]